LKIKDKKREREKERKNKHGDYKRKEEIIEGN